MEHCGKIVLMLAFFWISSLQTQMWSQSWIVNVDIGTIYYDVASETFVNISGTLWKIRYEEKRADGRLRCQHCFPFKVSKVTILTKWSKQNSSIQGEDDKTYHHLLCHLCECCDGTHKTLMMSLKETQLCMQYFVIPLESKYENLEETNHNEPTDTLTGWNVAANWLDMSAATSSRSLHHHNLISEHDCTNLVLENAAKTTHPPDNDPEDKCESASPSPKENVQERLKEAMNSSSLFAAA